MNKYDGLERRTGKLKEKIIKILERILGDHLQFSKEIISAYQVHGEINRGIGENDENFVRFINFFRELDVIRSAQDVEIPVRKIAEHIYRKSHYLDKKEYRNQRCH